MLNELCEHCKEPIEPGERAPAEGVPMHKECSLRLVVGSVGHQQRTCACYGRADTSEDGLTRREAARAAVREYLARDESVARALVGFVRGGDEGRAA